MVSKPLAKINWRVLVVIAITVPLVGAVLWYVGFLIEHDVLIPKQRIAPPIPQKVETNEIQIQKQHQAQNLQGWQTYRNEKYGFEVRYPTEWFLVWRNESVLELLNEQRSAVGTGSENLVLLQLIVSRESSLVDLFETLKIASAGIPYEKDLVIYTKLEDFRIGEIPAIRYKADRTAIPYVGLPISQEVLFRKGESVFQVFFLGFSNSALNQHKDLMDQILSTFRFID